MVKPNNNIWKDTCFRFVAFMDIMGFRDRVYRGNHSTVLADMESFINEAIAPMQDKYANIKRKKVFRLFEHTTIRPILFSDSIIFLSNNNSVEALENMTWSVRWLIARSMSKGIPLKGSIAYGRITASKEKSLYFGRALIDAVDLQDDMKIYGVVLHHSTEQYLYKHEIEWKEHNLYLHQYAVPMKEGKVNHLMIDWYSRVSKKLLPINWSEPLKLDT